MKKKLRVAALLSSLALCVAMSGCGSTGDQPAQGGDEEKTDIRFGYTATSLEYAEAMAQSMEDAGFQVEMVLFDDYVTPNQALVEGSVDITYHQHRAYMEAFNRENNADLYMLEPQISITPFAAYSDKWKSVEELPDGAKIGISRDSSNTHRCLMMLQDMGLITLDGDLETYTVADVAENPKNLEILQMDNVAMVSALPDVDMALMYNKHWIAAGRDASEALYTESDDAVYSYASGLAINGENKDAKWVQDIIDAVTSPESKERLEAVAAEFGGNVVF